MDLTKYYNIFSEESQTYLREAEQLLMQAENRPDERQLWEKVHGRLHSLKGMARTLSLDHISTLSHGMEGWCLELQQGRRTVTPLLMETLFNGIDLLKSLVTHRSPDNPLPEQQRYNRLLARFQAAQPAPPARPGPIGSAATPMDLLAVPQKLDYVRVRYTLIEELLGLAREILLKDRSLPPLSDEQLTPALRSWLDDHGSSLKGLMFRLAELRLMSIHQFADLFSRSLRDLARQHGKQVELRVAGGTIEADISLLERLREPLTHIFRNCLAHGIESPERRSQLGKPPAGKITLDARRQGGSLEMRIADDGQGIDRDEVTDFLKHRRGMRPAAIEGLSSSAFYETILDPEFSTATGLSELAGRGIGMHAVRQAMTFLGGTLAIQSQPHKGTQYTLRLPLSLSAIDALIFRLGDYVLAIPSSRIAKIDQFQYAQPRPLGAPPNVTCHDLAKLFKLTPRRRKSYYLLYLQQPPTQPNRGATPQTCIAVDQVIGSRSLMVLPPGKLLTRAGIYSGVGILGDGTLAPVIDTDGWLPSSGDVVPASQTGEYLLG